MRSARLALVLLLSTISAALACSPPTPPAAPVAPVEIVSVPVAVSDAPAPRVARAKAPPERDPSSWATDPKRTEGSVRGGTYHMSYEEGSTAYADLYTEARHLLDKDDRVAARALYRRLAKLEPESPHPYVGLGTCALGDHAYEEAKELFKEGIQKDPRTSLAILGLGSALYLQGDHAAAARTYERALEVNPQLADAHWGAAIAHEALGNGPRMREHAQRFVDMAPTSHLVPRALAMINRR